MCASAIAEEHNYYKHLRYPSKLVPGVGRDKVEQEGEVGAAGYNRRTVQWWPRKGQDVVDIPEGAPLRTWTRNKGQQDGEALAGLGQSWNTTDPETFEAHLVALRSFGTSTVDSSDPWDAFVPMAVLRMANGEQRAVLNYGPIQMVGVEDYEFVRKVWEDAYPKLYATVSQDAHLARKQGGAGGANSDLPLELWTAARPKFNAVETPKEDAEYPVWGENDDKVVFETKHYHIVARRGTYGKSGKWIRPGDVRQQNLYRKGVMEFAENFWTYVEAAGASMPFWRLEGPNYKYVVLVQNPGYGGGGGWMHCGVGDCRPNTLGHELFHSMPNGGWSGYFFESMCDSGQHTSVPGRLHMFGGNFSYPWRNVNRVAYKSSLWCFVLGDNPNWGYGIQTVLGSLAGTAESTPYHTIARLGQQKGLWKNGVKGFGDFFGEYAARMVTCDFVEQFLIRSKYGTPPLSYVYPVYGHENRYRISNGQAPRWCGYNIVRLKRAKDAAEITVDFQGIYDAKKHSDWRACIVAVDENGKPRYSPLWNKGEMQFALKPSDIRLWLTVAATPSAFLAPQSSDPSNSWLPDYVTGIHAPRYPWEVTLTGCEPGLPHRKQGDVVNFDDLYPGGGGVMGSPLKQEVPTPLTEGEGKFAQEKLDAMLLRIEAASNALSENNKSSSNGRPKMWTGRKQAYLKKLAARARFLQRSAEGHRHGNGGGFVSDLAQVADTAYVGPNAMVLNDCRVEDNARINGAAVIFGPGAVISGNAKVGGKAWVIGSIEVGDDARILEAATVTAGAGSKGRPGVRITGSAVFKGDATVSLGGANQTITGGVVVDYTPRISGGGDEYVKYGRFYSAPARRYNPVIEDGTDAGALYANWQFNQPKDVLLEDSYVNNNGILYGSPDFSDDDGHQCIVFNGKDQYAEAPPTVADFGELTVDMLINRSGDKGGRLFDFGSGEDECFYLAIGGQSGKPTLTARHKGKSYSVAATEGIPADKWVRIRVEMDGATATIHVDGKRVAKQAFALSPRMVFIGDIPEGNFIACGRNQDEFFNGRIDHFRIYRKVHDDFNALGPVPPALTQVQERSDDTDAAAQKQRQPDVVYHTTADWEDRTPEEVGDKVPAKMKEWLIRVRGY